MLLLSYKFIITYFLACINANRSQNQKMFEKIKVNAIPELV